MLVLCRHTAAGLGVTHHSCCSAKYWCSYCVCSCCSSKYWCRCCCTSTFKCSSSYPCICPAAAVAANAAPQVAQQQQQQDVRQLLQQEEGQLAQLLGRAVTALAALDQDGRGTRAAAAAPMGITTSPAVDNNTVRAFIDSPEEYITEGDQTVEDLVWSTSPDLLGLLVADAADAAGDLYTVYL